MKMESHLASLTLLQYS